MSISLILLIVLVLLMVGSVPAWPYSRGWGYEACGAFLSILVVVFLLRLLGVF